jgi:hypothetical protein
MYINSNDSKFVGDDGQIVYFVDADIAATFADPGYNLHYFSLFSLWLDKPLLFGTATLTVEYIFSGKLPGQIGKTLITPDHYEEFEAMAAAIASKGHSKAATIAEGAAKGRWQDEIRQVALAHSEGKIPAETALEQLVKALPEAMAALLQGPVAEAEQFARLLREDLMVRADTTEWFSDDIFAPNSAEVGQWTRRLREELTRAERKRGSTWRDRRANRSINRDARSLVQVLAVARNCASEEGRLRFVLVTGDPILRNAYHRHRWGDGRVEEDLVRVEIRHPIEFSPLLNLTAMSGDENRRSLFEDIMGALEALLIRVPVEGNNSSAENKHEIESAPAYIGGMQRGSAAGSRAGRIAHLRDLWSDAARTALALNSVYVIRRNEAQFKAFVEILDKPDIVTAAIGRLRDLVELLSRSHVRLTLQGIVATFLRRAGKRSQLVPGYSGRRAPLLVYLERFKPIIGELNINDFLDLLYSGAIGVPYEALARAPDRGLSLLFGSCVAIAAEDWDSAQSFAQQAIGLLANDQEAEHEARYCWALALRLSLKSYETLEGAIGLLLTCERFHAQRNQRFRWLRAKTELGAVIRVFLYKRELIPNFEARGCPPVAELWKQAWEHLADVEDNLKEKREHEIFYRQLGVQVSMNLVALAIYAKRYARESFGISDLQFRDELDELNLHINNWPESSAGNRKVPALFFTACVLKGVLEFIEAESEEVRLAAGHSTRLLIEQHLPVLSTLPAFEQAQYQEMLSWLPEATQY